MVSVEHALMECWGEPQRRASFGRQGETFGLFRWDVHANSRRHALYAAFNRTGTTSPSVTLAFFSETVDDIAPEMTWTHRQIQADPSIRCGDSVDLKRPLWPGANLHIFYVSGLLEPVSTWNSLKLLRGITLQQVTPIYDSEVSLKKNIGVVTFERRLAEVDYGDPLRAPLR